MPVTDQTIIESSAAVAPVADAATEAAGGANIMELLWGSGPLVRLVLWGLIAASVVTWAIVWVKSRQFSRATGQSKEFSDAYWTKGNLKLVYQVSKGMDDSPSALMFNAAYEELPEVAAGESTADTVIRAMKKVKADQITRFERGLTFLATTASAAPFVGLFGTVWGIMNAFIGLSQAHSSSIQAVAPGISEALIATAVGLAAAIPAAIAYNFFAQKIKLLVRDMDTFAGELSEVAKKAERADREETVSKKVRTVELGGLHGF